MLLLFHPQFMTSSPVKLVSHMKFLSSTHTHIYSAEQSHEAQVERESVFKVISRCLCATSETVGENERVKKQDRRLGGVGGAPTMLKLTDVSHG